MMANLQIKDLPYKHYEMINKTKNNLNLRLTEVIKKRLGENVVFSLTETVSCKRTVSSRGQHLPLRHFI